MGLDVKPIGGGEPVEVDAPHPDHQRAKTIGFAIAEERPLAVAFDEGWGWTITAILDRRTGETLRFGLSRDQLRNLCHDILDVAWDDRT